VPGHEHRSPRLSALFDTIEVGSVVRDIKDEPIARVVRKLGIDASEVAYVGDTVTDMAAAQRAGVLV
jgi:phosphoglycolate phosphatase-like HAD superfamily hydrolase